MEIIGNRRNNNNNYIYIAFKCIIFKLIGITKCLNYFIVYY